MIFLLCNDRTQHYQCRPHASLAGIPSGIAIWMHAVWILIAM